MVHGVLVISDENLNDILKSLFDKKYRIYTAENIEEGMRQFWSIHPDFVLSKDEIPYFFGGQVQNLEGEIEMYFKDKTNLAIIKEKEIKIYIPGKEPITEKIEKEGVKAWKQALNILEKNYK